MAKEKGKYDGLLCFLLALIVVLILVIGGGAYYFLVLDNGEEITNTIANTNINNTDTKIETESKAETQKEENNVQETNGIVYSYYDEKIIDEEENILTYKIPRININSQDVLKINQEIENFYKPYLDYAQGKETSGVYIQTLGINYNYTINNNILSLLVYVKPTAGNSSEILINTYNIDMSIGKRLTNSEIIASKHMTNEMYLEILTSECKEIFTDAYGDTREVYANKLRNAPANWSEEEIEREKTHYDYALNTTLKNCSMETKLFLGVTGKINVIGVIGSLAGGETTNMIVDLGI